MGTAPSTVPPVYDRRLTSGEVRDVTQRGPEAGELQAVVRQFEAHVHRLNRRTLTARVEQVVVTDQAIELTFVDTTGDRETLALQMTPRYEEIEDLLVDAMSIIVTVRPSSELRSVLLRRGGRRDEVDLQCALALLARGVHGVVRWTT